MRVSTPVHAPRRILIVPSLGALWTSGLLSTLVSIICYDVGHINVYSGLGCLLGAPTCDSDPMDLLGASAPQLAWVFYARPYSYMSLLNDNLKTL